MANILYFEIDLICSVILLLIYITDSERGSSDISRKLYNQLSFTVIGLLLTDGTGWLIEGKTDMLSRIVMNSCVFLCDCLACIASFLWMLYTLAWVVDAKRINIRKAWPLALPSCFGIIGIIINIRIPLFYYIDSRNIYHRASFFFVFYLILVFYVLFAFVYAPIHTVRAKEERRRKKNFFITAVILLPVAGSIIQVFSYGLITIWPAMTVALVCLYISLQVQKEAKEKLMIERMKYDMVKKDVSVMLSQIQPHFLFNALSTIKGLALTDTDKACEAIDSFSIFLRGNTLRWK